MTGMEIGVHRVVMDSPADTSGLETMIVAGVVNPHTIIACIGKTEGNGGANDFTRALATLSYQRTLAKYIGVEQSEKIAFVWSGGTEGVLSPHATVFTRTEREAMHSLGGQEGLALSVQTTSEIAPEHVGRSFMVEEVATATRKAMEDAGVTRKEDVHYVQVKGPLLTSAGIRDALSRGKTVVTNDPNLSKGFARGAMALGVALALGEIDGSGLNFDEVINQDMSLYSRVASTSAGGELKSCEVILMANTSMGMGPFTIGHSQIKDAIDTEGVREAIRNAGIEFDGLATEDQQKRVVAVFAKAEASSVIRGFRTTMYSDADIHYERHARAAVGAIISSVIGGSAIFVSGGTEHQCMPGSAPVAAIVKRQT